MSLSDANTHHHIWIIEDDENMRFVYDDILKHLYQITFFDSLEGFAQGLSVQHPPDLLILDLVLPDGLLHLSFPEYAPSLKNVPFLVVSALDEEEAVRASLKWGALDYITKPFGKSEIQVKIEAHMNRLKPKLEVEPLFRVDPLTLTIFNHWGRSQELTSKEFRIMSLFLDASKNRISRKEIFETLWANVRVSQKTLDVHLSNVRRKIENLKLSIVLNDSDYHICLHDDSIEA